MKKQTLWVIVVLVLSALACNLPFGQGGQVDGDIPDPDAGAYSADVQDETVLEPVALSGAQRQILAAYGLPDRFMILFSDELREETWYYDFLGYSITFRNGDIYTDEQTVSVADAEVLTSTYYPWQFNGQMGLSELLAVSESETFAIESLDGIFQDDASLVYLKGLDAGFQKGQILYIRAIPVGAGASEAANSADAGESEVETTAGTALTAEEQIHLGAHTYQMACTYSDGSSENDIAEATWEFTDEGVYYDGEGPFPKISDNYYGSQDEFGGFFIMFSADTIAVNGSFIMADDEGNPVTTTFNCTLILE